MSAPEMKEGNRYRNANGSIYIALSSHVDVAGDASVLNEAGRACHVQVTKLAEIDEQRPTIGHRWMNIYDNFGWATREQADENRLDETRDDSRTRLGVLHLFPDGTIEMEQP